MTRWGRGIGGAIGRGLQVNPYAGGGPAAAPWTPLSIPNLFSWMPTHNIHHMWQQGAANTTAPILPPSASSNVGSIDDPCPASFRWEAISAAVLPILSGWSGVTAASGAQSALWLSGSAAASTSMRCVNSIDAFNFLHQQVTGVIAFKALFQDDGRAQVIGGTAGSQAAASYGWQLQRTTSNTLQFTLSCGRGVLAINYTTNATCLQASGVIPVVIQLGDPTRGNRIRVGYNPWELMSQSVLGSASGSTVTGSTSNPDLVMGRTVGSSASGFKGFLANLIVVSGTISDSDLANFYSYDPAFTSGTNLVSTQSNGQYNFLQRWYDFTDTGSVGSLFSDSAGTTPITADNTVIGRVQHKLFASNSLRREAIANGGPNVTGPKYLAASGGAVYMGHAAPNNLAFAQAAHGPGGASWFVVMKENGTGSGGVEAGAHILTTVPGGNYWAVTGRFYPAQVSDAGASYNTLHLADAADIGANTLANQHANFNILEFRRNGVSMYVRNHGLTGTIDGGCVNDTNALGSFNIGHIGASGSTGWLMSGTVCEYMLYNAYLTEGQAANVLGYLRNKYRNILP